MRWVLVTALLAGLFSDACGIRRADSERASVDDASRTYVRLVRALGERDSGSLDSYHGPSEWRAQAQREHASLAGIRAGAVALAESLKGNRAAADADTEDRRAFLRRQLAAVASRIDVLHGARPLFDEEARLLFGLDPHAVATLANTPHGGREP